jgi:hypothetical protein
MRSRASSARPIAACSRWNSQILPATPTCLRGAGCDVRLCKHPPAQQRRRRSGQGCGSANYPAGPTRTAVWLVRQLAIARLDNCHRAHVPASPRPLKSSIGAGLQENSGLADPCAGAGLAPSPARRSAVVRAHGAAPDPDARRGSSHDSVASPGSSSLGAAVRPAACRLGWEPNATSSSLPADTSPLRLWPRPSTPSRLGPGTHHGSFRPPSRAKLCTSRHTPAFSFPHSRSGGRCFTNTAGPRVELGCFTSSRPPSNRASLALCRCSPLRCGLRTMRHRRRTGDSPASRTGWADHVGAGGSGVYDRRPRFACHLAAAERSRDGGEIVCGIVPGALRSRAMP